GDALAHGLQLLREGAVDGVLDPVRAAAEALGDQDVRELVHRQPRQAVGLPEDEAAAAEGVHDSAAVFEGVLHPPLEEGGAEIFVRVVREDAQAYLARGAVEARAEPGALLGEDVADAALLRLARDGCELLPVDPGVALSYGIFGLPRDGYGREFSL